MSLMDLFKGKRHPRQDPEVRAQRIRSDATLERVERLLAVRAKGVDDDFARAEQEIRRR